MAIFGDDLVHAVSQLKEELHFGDIILQISFDNDTGIRSNYTYAELEVLDDETNTIVTPLETELTDAYTRWQAAQAIRDSESEAQRLTKEDVKALLASELVKDTPDTAAAYAALQVVIVGNTRLTNAHQNTADLFGYDTGTPLGYLRAAYLLIALMS